MERLAGQHRREKWFCSIQYILYLFDTEHTVDGTRLLLLAPAFSIKRVETSSRNGELLKGFSFPTPPTQEPAQEIGH